MQPAGAPPGVSTGQNDHTQLYGIIGMIVGLICCPIVGIVFGILSIRDARRFSNSPTLGYVAIGLSIVGFIWSLTVGLRYR